jgi:hypothetical protein
MRRPFSRTAAGKLAGGWKGGSTPWARRRHHIASAAVGANYIHVDGSHVRRVRPYDHPNSTPPRRGFFAAAPLINEVTTLS